jgi:hypothetical protein
MSYWIFDGFRLNSRDPRNNGVLYNGQHVDHLRFQNMDLTNNYATNAPTLGDWLVLGGDATGMCLTGGGDQLEFVNIEIHQCGAYGVYYWGHDSVFDHLNVHDTYGYGLHLYHYAASDVNNNVVKSSQVHDVHWVWRNGGKTNANGILLSSGSGNMAYDNIVWNLFPTGDAYGGGTGIGAGYGSSGYRVYHNTIFDDSGQGVGISVSYLDVGGAEIENNIVSAAYGLVDWTGVHPTYSHNLCSSPGPGCDHVVDPGFVDSTTQPPNLHLQAGSPAIDAAPCLSEVPTDLDGVARPQGAGCDIGAYEWRR